LVVAAVVTRLALSLSKRPSGDGCYENEKTGFWSMVGFGKCSGDLYFAGLQVPWFPAPARMEIARLPGNADYFNGRTKSERRANWQGL